ncbi:MAG: type II toxin-antitoxin system HicA family toxin [Fimbriimonadaceae bacterium]|nr:type II toxin-antitoxin system HicA family toxin [Fimbriimonadaceae bacterium]
MLWSHDGEGGGLADGCRRVVSGSAEGVHAVYKHASKPGRVVVPMHAGDLPKGTLNDILKKSGLKK